jgi:hypothetical protein
MFRNRHVVIALLVAPILAVLAWFAVGNLLGERASPARVGQSYPLLARSNCRYESGRCDLENEDLKLSLLYESVGGGLLQLRASHRLDSVLVAVATPDSEASPRSMQAMNADGRSWRLQASGGAGEHAEMRLVAAAAGARYFAQTPARFMRPVEP